MESNLPVSLRKNIGKMMIEKGVTDDGLLKIYQWDAVDRCRNEECPAYSRCSCLKGEDCAIQVACVQSVLDLVFSNYEEYITEPLLFQIGMHLLPMYKILSKMLICEMSVEDLMYQNSRGDWITHPLYRDIREQIKCISNMWKDLGLPVHAGDIRTNLNSMVVSSTTSA